MLIFFQFFVYNCQNWVNKKKSRDQIGVESILKRERKEQVTLYTSFKFSVFKYSKKMYSQQHRQYKCDNKSHILLHTKADDGHVCQTER